MGHQLHGDYRGSITKGGPRVLTFAPVASPTLPNTLSNCVTCDTYDPDLVTGERGGVATLLVHGWYEIQADVDIFWRQLNPEDACAENLSGSPLLTGGKLVAGGCCMFFVDEAKRDGVIAVTICSQDLPPVCTADRPEGLVRVLRKDTILTMAQTGENANLKSAEVSNACE